ncbi:MAG TPA: DUF3617 domain-containing protein, partial [Burkholderiales bacterium]|nr:DUF3617 domain-containing protein [Burkholderiales bacterium]
MRQRLIPLSLFILACTAARAQDISPGLWEITVNSLVAASPGFAPDPVKQTQCLSAQDARDPRRLFGELSAPGASGCSYGKSRISGNNLQFTMQCAGSLNLHASGDMSFAPESISGTITSSANLGGQQVSMQSQVSGRRVGSC